MRRDALAVGDNRIRFDLVDVGGTDGVVIHLLTLGTHDEVY